MATNTDIGYATIVQYLKRNKNGQVVLSIPCEAATDVLLAVEAPFWSLGMNTVELSNSDTDLILTASRGYKKKHLETALIACGFSKHAVKNLEKRDYEWVEDRSFRSYHAPCIMQEIFAAVIWAAAYDKKIPAGGQD